MTAIFNHSKYNTWQITKRQYLVYKKSAPTNKKNQTKKKLRWLDIVFQGQYVPSLGVNFVAISKDLEKLTPQLY